MWRHNCLHSPTLIHPFPRPWFVSQISFQLQSLSSAPHLQLLQRLHRDVQWAFSNFKTQFYVPPIPQSSSNSELISMNETIVIPSNTISFLQNILRLTSISIGTALAQAFTELSGLLRTLLLQASCPRTSTAPQIYPKKSSESKTDAIFPPKSSAVLLVLFTSGVNHALCAPLSPRPSLSILSIL